MSEEHTGGSVEYYKVQVMLPTTKNDDRFPVGYWAECNDIIKALGMNYAEGNEFKSLWRRCAEKNLGKKKLGNTALYDAQKSVFFANDSLEQVEYEINEEEK